MDNILLKKIAFFLSQKSYKTLVPIKEIQKKFNVPISSELFNLGSLNKELAEISNKKVELEKKKTLRILITKNSKFIEYEKIKAEIEEILKNTPKDLKKINQAAGKFLAFFFKNNKESCTITMASNKLKMNGFLKFDLHESLKYANLILKECRLKLYLKNGYIFLKEIDICNNILNFKKIDPILQINDRNCEFKKFKLFIYDSINNLYCPSELHHKTENVTLVTKNCLGKIVKFNAFHCLNCNKYYTTLTAIKNDFPILHYPFVPLKFNNNSDFYLNEQSELKLYGYNVQKNGLSEYERKNLLLNLLYYEILTKHKIISILQFNINFHQSNPNFSEAIMKWEDDLNFVQNYNLNEQKIISTNDIDIIYKGKNQNK